MHRWLFTLIIPLTVLSMLPTSVTAQAASGQGADIESRLPGAYRLISYVTWDRDGTETRTPFTEGTIMYDESGRMSVHLRTPDRPVAPGQSLDDAGRARLYSSYIAYYGAYSINPDEGYVTHHVEGGLSPGLGGTDQIRYYQLSPDGRDLTLQVRNDGRVVGEVRWERNR